MSDKHTLNVVVDYCSIPFRHGGTNWESEFKDLCRKHANLPESVFDSAYQIAWEAGHSFGYAEVVHYLSDLVDLAHLAMEHALSHKSECNIQQCNTELNSDNDLVSCESCEKMVSREDGSHAEYDMDGDPVDEFWCKACHQKINMGNPGGFTLFDE